MRYLLFFLLLCCGYFSNAQLNGTYTIGGTSPNYASITGAVNDLITQGVSGNVTFNIRNGTYIEKVTIPAITGASSSNRITFQSESLDTAAVKWRFNGTVAADNYVLKLDGADYITLRHLTFQRMSTSYGCRTITFENGASNNILENSHCKGKVFVSSTDHELLYSPNSSDTANIIRNNHLENGWFGIYFLGSSGTVTENSTSILNNRFTGHQTGIFYLNFSNLRINNNTITSVSVPVNLNTGLKNTWILNNSMTAMGGVMINAATPGVSDSVNISGNMIRCTSGSGIYLTSCSYVYVFHNTVKVNSSGLSAALYCNIVTFIRAHNNIFHNTSSGYSMVFQSTSVNSDYNILHSFTTNFIRYATTTYTNLTNWQNALLQDDNSFFSVPGYVSATDLHLASDIQAHNNAVNLSLGADLDGNARSTTPDIGADEFNQPDHDAGILSLNNIPLRTCSGSTNVLVNLRNYGAQALTSVNIHWKVNGVVQPIFAWTGSLTSGDTSFNINIGTFTILQDNNYTFKIWTELPNGFADTLNQNDTLNYGLVKTKMAGTYTIGGTSPSYTTINASYADLTDRGVCSSVVFNIRPGNYMEALTLTNITGASYANTITYQSELLDSSTVKIMQSESSFSPYWLIGTSAGSTGHFRFRHLTLTRSNDPFGSVNNLVGIGDANNMKFEYCHFKGATFQSGFAFDCNYSSNIVVQYCHFESMGRGVYVLNSSFPKDSNMVIRNNIFTNIGSDNLAFNYVNDSLIILDNEITNDTITTPDGYGLAARGISLGLNYGTIHIERNKIIGRFDGAMILHGLQGTISKPAKVYNNFIVCGSKNTNGAIGVSLQASSYLEFVHNSIRMYNTPWSAWGTISKAAIHFTTIGGLSNMKFVNNIIQADSCEYVYKFGSGFPTAFAQFDYNNVYMTYPSYTIESDALGWPGSFNANTIHINPLFASRDDLHINNPAMLGGMPTGLIADIDNDIRDLTNPTRGADDGNFFSFDVGSILPSLDHTCDTTFISARVFNYGYDTLTQFSIEAEADGVPLGTVSWTGLLYPGDTSGTISLGGFVHDFGTTHSIEIYTSVPDGFSDQDVTNDTSLLSFNLPEYILEIGPDLLLCDSESVWTAPTDTTHFTQYNWSTGETTTGIYISSTGLLTLEAIDVYGCIQQDSLMVGTVATISPDISNDMDSLYTDISGNNQWYFNGFPITGATNDFHIALTNGNYYVQHVDTNGCTVYSDTITITGLVIGEILSVEIELFPNPADRFIQISAPENSLGRILLYNANGQLIQSYIPSNPTYFELNTLAFPSGFYQLTIQTEEKIIRKKILVLH